MLQKRFSVLYLYIVILLVCTINFSLIAYALPAAPGVDARSAILIDAYRGQVLYKKNPDERLHIAAASKIMTALVVVENARMDSLITASKASANTEGAQLKMIVGEKYSVESLLYAILLTNANDAANALAEYVGGDLDTFVSMMNDYAIRLNMSNTVFKNPTGLYHKGQFTTAHDLSILVRYALKNPDFNKIFGTQAKPWFDNNKTLVLANQNELFWSYDGVDGGKIGYNDPALPSIITTATKNEQRLICILLDSPKKSMYTDSIKILDYGFNNFIRGILISKGQALVKVMVDGNEVNMLPITDVYYTHPKGENYIENVSFEKQDDKLSVPLYTNTVIGSAKYTLKDGTIINVELYPNKEILPKLTQLEKLKKRLSENIELMYIVIFLIGVEIILAISYIFRIIHRHITKKQ